MVKTIKPNDVFIASLTELPLFKCLSPEQRRTLAECAHVYYCDPGEALFREGDPAEMFFILKCGRVKMRRVSTSGKEVVLHLSSPPHMIGCKSLTIPGSLFPADAIAVDSVIALGFRRDHFLERVAHIPDVFFSLLIELNRRLSEIYSLQGTLLEPIERRIATLLLNQASQDPNELDLSNLKPVHITKNLIASIVGTSTETAIRILSRWKKAGLVSTERGKITIVDIEAVCRIAGTTEKHAVPRQGFEV